MSILIKDMDMPTTCRECVIGNPKAKTCIIGKPKMNTKRRDDCPLVEIPTPHGRLIDADAVNKAMDERIEKLKDDKSLYEASCVATALDMFAPTVIEAEGSETE